MLVGRNVPQLLDAKAINLRAAILPQLEDARQFLGQMAARALGEEGVAGVQFHSGLVVGLALAVARNAHVAGRDALHRAVVVEQDFGGGESGENLDAQRFGFARKPAAQIAEAGAVGALVVHEGAASPSAGSPICPWRSAPNGGFR